MYAENQSAFKSHSVSKIYEIRIIFIPAVKGSLFLVVKNPSNEWRFAAISLQTPKTLSPSLNCSHSPKHRNIVKCRKTALMISCLSSIQQFTRGFMKPDSQIRLLFSGTWSKEFILCSSAESSCNSKKVVPHYDISGLIHLWLDHGKPTYLLGTNKIFKETRFKKFGHI